MLMIVRESPLDNERDEGISLVACPDDKRAYIIQISSRRVDVAVASSAYHTQTAKTEAWVYKRREETQKKSIFYFRRFAYFTEIPSVRSNKRATSPSTSSVLTVPYSFSKRKER